MAKLSDYLENKLIDHLFRSTAFAQPAGIYLALGTAAADGSFTELVGGGYARISCGRGDASWSTAPLSSVLTTDKVSATATADWGDITVFALYDAASGGNMLFHGTMTHACRVYTGEQFRVPYSAMQFRFD